MKVISTILFVIIALVCVVVLMSHQTQQQAYDFCGQLYSGLPLTEAKQRAADSGMQLDASRSNEELTVFLKSSPLVFWEQHACQVTHNRVEVVRLEFVTYSF